MIYCIIPEIGIMIQQKARKKKGYTFYSGSRPGSGPSEKVEPRPLDKANPIPIFTV